MSATQTETSPVPLGMILVRVESGSTSYEAHYPREFFPEAEIGSIFFVGNTILEVLNA